MQKFFIGDVVNHTRDAKSFVNVPQIISECDYLGGGVFEYCTNYGGWFEEEELVLVRRVDSESLAKLDEYVTEGE